MKKVPIFAIAIRKRSSYKILQGELPEWPKGHVC